QLSIIIDGAIIMANSIAHRLGSSTMGGKRHTLKTILAAALEVERSICFSVLLIIGTYLPLLTLTSIEGLRGLPGCSSLARLLCERRGVRNHLRLPRLTVEQVVAWAEAHRRRTGRWPTAKAGPVEGARGETWRGVATALEKGLRGLPGGLSLPGLRARGEQPAKT